jgi:hypothetical protein
MDLYWLLGSDFTDTSMIYHLYTDEVDKLPENRIQYKFDNISFREKSGTELEPIGKYRAFKGKRKIHQRINYAPGAGIFPCTRGVHYYSRWLANVRCAGRDQFFCPSLIRLRQRRRSF